MLEGIWKVKQDKFGDKTCGIEQKISIALSSPEQHKLDKLAKKIQTLESVRTLAHKL